MNSYSYRFEKMNDCHEEGGFMIESMIHDSGQSEEHTGIRP